MRINWRLLKAIREKGLRQRDFARIVGEHESVVSRVISGQWNPCEKRKAVYARALGMKPADLFPGGDDK